MRTKTRGCACGSSGMGHSIFYPHLPYGRHFFVLSSMALSESVTFALIGGVGIAILAITDPPNHFFSQSPFTLKKQGCRNLYSSKWVCRNLSFIHSGIVGVPFL